MIRAALAALAAAGIIAACAMPGFPIGEPCMNDVDCQTGACIAQVCAFPPAKGNPYGDAGAPATDAGDGGVGDDGSNAADDAAAHD